MKIEMVELQTADLAMQQAFYGTCLGLPTHLNRDSLRVEIGSSTLIFHAASGFSGRYHFAMNIPENRLDAVLEFLRNKQIESLSDANGEAIYHFDSWNAHAIYFYDSAGNIVEFIARHELPNASPHDPGKPFSIKEILSLSEMGVAVDDVLKSSAELSERLDIRPYREGSSDFMPLGDANGLLILVPTGRLWFPHTGISAEALPARMQLQIEGYERASVIETNSGEIAFES